MDASMPSPFGHALAGIAVALAGDPQPVAGSGWRFLSRPMTLCCVALATLPDADLLFRNFHRTMTHSLGATILVIIVATAVTGWVTRVRSSPVGAATHRRGDQTARTTKIGWGVVWLLAAAHASHLLTDWLGTDLSIPAGIQLFWPFSDRWFISPSHLFLQLDRRDIFSLPTITLNLRALLWELALLGPIVGALWWFRNRTPSTAARRPQKTG